MQREGSELATVPMRSPCGENWMHVTWPRHMRCPGQRPNEALAHQTPTPPSFDPLATVAESGDTSDAVIFPLDEVDRIFVARPSPSSRW